MFCDWPGLVHILTPKARSGIYNQLSGNEKACWEDQNQTIATTTKQITTTITGGHNPGYLLIQLSGLIPESEVERIL